MSSFSLLKVFTKSDRKKKISSLVGFNKLAYLFSKTATKLFMDFEDVHLDDTITSSLEWENTSNELKHLKSTLRSTVSQVKLLAEKLENLR